MIATSFEEALLSLAYDCEDVTAVFTDCAERARAPLLRTALYLRAAQCRASAAAIKPLTHSFTDSGRERRRVKNELAWLMRAVEYRHANSNAWASTARANTHTESRNDELIFARYEAAEGVVLAAFRDVLDQPDAEEVKAQLVPQFEAALNQYLQLVRVRVALTQEKQAANEDRAHSPMRSPERLVAAEAARRPVVRQANNLSLVPAA